MIYCRCISSSARLIGDGDQLTADADAVVVIVFDGFNVVNVTGDHDHQVLGDGGIDFTAEFLVSIQVAGKC